MILASSTGHTIPNKNKRLQMTDKQWESQEISMWINNDEGFYRLAKASRNHIRFFQALENMGVSEIGGIKLTPENVRESWKDANY